VTRAPKITVDNRRLPIYRIPSGGPLWCPEVSGRARPRIASERKGGHVPASDPGSEEVVRRLTADPDPDPATDPGAAAGDPADPGATNPADPPASTAANADPPTKDDAGEKRVVREMMQKVEELLRALGKFAGAPAGDDDFGGVALAEPTDLGMFLAMNAEEGFDLEELNAIDLRALQKEARGDKALLREVMQKVAELLPRVHSETGVPALAGAVLRNKTLQWYLASPSDPEWPTKMVPRWGGIFAESRIPGGRLSPALSTRLASLHSECAKTNGWAVAFARIQVRAGALFGRMSLIPSLLLRSKRSFQPIVPQVAQAYLDDLAARRRASDAPLPMERLSRLGRRMGPMELNVMLGELFPQEGAESFVVLDPHLHPDTEGVMVRPPPPKASGDEVTYELVRPNAPLPIGSAGGSTVVAPTSPWHRQDLTVEEWRGVLGALEKSYGKLDPPPIDDYRSRPSYLALREFILDDPSACTSFRAVRWRGRPTGLVLLSQLLAQGTLAPEVETDGDYLEAELSHIEKGDPDQRPTDGHWNLGHGWTIVRETAWGNLTLYRANRPTADATVGSASTGPAAPSPSAPSPSAQSPADPTPADPEPEELGVPAQ